MSTVAELLLAQVAAESYLTASLNDPNDRLRLGNNNPGIAGNTANSPILTGATRMTEAQITSFNALYEISSHLPNTWTGFSATLLRNKITNEYVLSFRSTEYADDIRG